MRRVIEYKARTKAGRAWIAKILDCATSVVRVEIDNVADTRQETEIPVELLRKFVEIDGRDAVIYELTENDFVYISGAAGRHVTKYVLRTYPFDPTDLPVIKES